tara:strand:+ start:2739 stop:3500 length:762 start_codon:yes stop_codon:yes gene_type:complete
MWFDRKSLREIQAFREKVPKRVKRLQHLVLLELVGLFLKRLKDLAPEVGERYPGGLELAVVKGIRGLESVCVVYLPREQKMVLDKNEVVFVVPRDEATRSIEVLSKHHPWPHDLLPFQPEKSEATLVSRSATPQEAEIARQRILRSRQVIDAQLRAVGAPGSIGERRGDLSASEDVGFQVLRKETGAMEAPHPHWVPALKALRSDIRSLEAKAGAYLRDGREHRFNIPDAGVVSPEILRDDRFGAMIAARIGQ